MNNETTNTYNSKLMKRKWFKWTLGISVVAVVALAITLPIVLLSGNGGKKQFDTKQEVWATMVPDTAEPYRGFSETTSETTSTPSSQAIINGLSPNTIYRGWYSNEYHGDDQAFKDFQTKWSANAIASIEYSLSIFEDIPTLPDEATITEIKKFNVDMKNHLSNFDETKTFTYVAKAAFDELQNTTAYTNDFGRVVVVYFGYEEKYSTVSFYEGSIDISQSDINSGSENLPEVYQYNQEILDGVTKIMQDYFSWLDENYKGLITEELYNKTFGIFPKAPTYDEVKEIYSNNSNMAFDYSVENIISN